jgi:integrase/recombinase XerD
MSLGVIMGLGKQSKILSDKQVKVMLLHLGTTRMSLRNQLIFLLSAKAGLRAKEASQLKWKMVVNSDGSIGNAIHLTDVASKGNSGRVIPLNKDVKDLLVRFFEDESKRFDFDINSSFVVRTERSKSTSAQSIVNMFANWYKDLGFVGCSSHSGRRTFITNLSKKIGLVGGTLRDVQSLAGHSNLQTTQRYIEVDTDCQRKLVDLV